MSCAEHKPSNTASGELLPEAKQIAGTSEGPIGLWRVPQEQEDAFNAEHEGGNTHYSKPASFLYDGEFVIMHLFTMKGWMWRSEDEFYRMRAEWQGDTLLIEPPFGRLTPLATFKGDHFVDENDSTKWIYERVGKAGVGEEEMLFLKPREPHNYDITPLGAIEPGWRESE